MDYYLEHADEKEIEAMKAEDPLEMFRARLTEENILSTAIEDELQARAKAMVEEAIKFAEQAPYPDVEDASYPVFVEDIRNA